MNNHIGSSMPLTLAGQGETVTLVRITGGIGITKRLTEMGLTPGTTIKILSNHFSGPVLIELRGSKLALGNGISQKIMVNLAQPCQNT